MSRYSTAIAMVLFGLVALLGVLSRPLLPVDETRYLTVAWEMHLSGDWLVPHLNGEIYSDKPPLLFWLINILWSFTGISETAARLIGPAFGIATIAATSALARRLWPNAPAIAGRAALILAGTGAFTAYAGLTMFDAMLSLAVILGILALTFVPQTKAGWLGFTAALAFGGLAKGPVILVHLIPAALLMPLWAGISLKRALLGTLVAIIAGVSLVGLWLAPALIHGGPAYREAVLWTQHAGRMVSSFAHLKPWWFFVALLPLLLWPWIWSVDFWRRLKDLGIGDRGLRLCMIWAGSTLLLFSLISGKQIHYLLPAFPAAALFFARATDEQKIGAPIAAFLPAILGLGLILAVFGLLPGKDVPSLAQPASAIAIIGVLLIGLALLIAVRSDLCIWIAGPGLVALCDLVFLFGAPGYLYDTTPIATLLAPHDSKGIAIIGQSYSGEFSFTGRLTHPVIEMTDLAAANDWLAQMPGRVLLARLDREHPASPADLSLVFRNLPYGIWTKADSNVSKSGNLP